MFQFRKKSSAVPKESERRIYVNQHDKNAEFHYADNYIKTSKYNIVTFLPKNLFEQFQRLANFYFLILLILQVIPQISSLTPITTVVPLVAVLTLTALKDAMDDIQRHRNDNLVNGRISYVLRDGDFREERWDKVVVGDIIRMENDQFVAADLFLLSSSEPHGLCYVETAELDGETNLKSRQALPETGELNDDKDAMSRLRAEVVCEPPNNNLSRFEGKITFDGSTYPLTNNQVLLRGCVLRNTAWCYGVVLFAGKDTKLMQNSGKTKFKQTSMDHLLNYIIIGIVIFLLSMCTICTVACGIWESQIGIKFQVIQPWEQFLQQKSAGSAITIIAVLVFFSYAIVLNTVVPISLYVSVEIIRFTHSFWINWDQDMVYKDIHAKARTTTLNEELGQIEYIFSDKTGTLTQNIMTFNKCSISGRRYGDCTDEKGEIVEPGEEAPLCDFSENPYADNGFRFFDSKLLKDVQKGDKDCDMFFRILSLCHTVMPDEKNGRLVYQAQSPDEGALVNAARNFGYVFLYRTPNLIRVKIGEEEVEYELLHILDFNNVRKRMSVILRKEGKIILYCKGADSIIMERLAKTPKNDELKNVVNEHLQAFACEGLRTLCLAWKEIDPSQYGAWQKKYHEATVAMENREETVDAVSEEIEKDLILAGATAIEDKLQEGVPDAIASLAQADIKIWVLTGDKLETAINIGYSCRLLTDEMREVFIIDADDALGVKDQLEKARQKLQNPDSSPLLSPAVEDVPRSKSGMSFHTDIENGQLGNGNMEADGACALVIQGKSLVHALEKELEESFLEVASLCKAVICCRVTPLQKALVVELVKKYKKAITLAIGDGANDVSMIKVAHIGVGISGQEGMQAVLASDFSIGQFRFLKRLLLVHGRWSYYRMSKFLRYFFYKNFAFTLCHMWYAFYCGFTAQTVYDPWFISFYNLFYTSLPILALGVFDQDVNDRNSIEFPKLYTPGHQNLLFNKAKFLRSMCHGIVTSVALFFIAYGAFHYSVDDLQGNQAFGTALATILIVTVTVQVALDTAYWTFFNFLTIIGSVVFYFALTLFMYSNLFTSSYLGSERKVYSNPAFWFTLVLTVVILMVPVVAARFFLVDTRPTLSDRVRLRQKNDSRIKRSQTSQLAARSSYSAPGTRRRKRGRQSVRSSYAFSHEKGFGDLITTGTNMPGGKESGSVRLWPKKARRRAENGKSPLESAFVAEETPVKEMEEVKFSGIADQVDGAQPLSRPVQITSL
ncbi:phospholipid-transporting ATPase ID-like [Paramacrobiotus metropolitanus]|uniref:phospholipid-transporting ATPase ID-like n=1 Tax=Paramacrobiotus metropolitanus TaxID=2943436 RepID=UPI0024461AEE|nr:phospholipid-transporting ATPase ID-like [Paramacrobiotus metropolitanus]XP_055329125.1 phospholipid-transporting ATPase ID-like [Paramacrobiotus metropolitanus]XP_055329133.1 phospholipid-transporting ATPase ID-like [Paramacrobiotus metropolitanus]